MAASREGDGHQERTHATWRRLVSSVPATVVLGVMPVLSTVQPKVAENLDPNGAILSLAQGQDSGRAAGILVGWVVLTTVAGTLLTRRRQVA